MTDTLANMKMDDVKTVRKTANSVAKLTAIPDECTVDAQVSRLRRLALPAMILRWINTLDLFFGTVQ